MNTTFLNHDDASSLDEAQLELLLRNHPDAWDSAPHDISATLNHLEAINSLLTSLPEPLAKPTLLLDRQSGIIEQQAIEGTLSVGREPASGWAVKDVSGLSREHFRIDHRNGAWFVDDCGSTNGIRIKGQSALVKSKALVNGDVILAGKAEFTFIDPEL